MIWPSSPIHTVLLIVALSAGILPGQCQTGSLIGTKVALDFGTFTGLQDNNTNIIYFRGVRYANNPSGDLRWKAPITPPTVRLGNVDATQFRNKCIQASQTSVESGHSEDCLFGNIAIPVNTRTDSNLPVMVWFHGGGWQGGDSRANPDLIIGSSAKPMIFVSFAYRLGHFGFLGGSQIKADGNLNAGVLDQRAALRWVQQYIGSFGGDKTKVTIWGESAGGGAVMFQLVANGGDNQGLFRAAIGDSASLSAVPRYNESYVEGIYTQFAGFAGCADKGTSTLSCLRAANSSTIALAGSQVLAARKATIYAFAPMIDDDFLRTRPVEAFSAGSFAKVPVIFGSNTNEGAGWSTGISDPAANTNTAGANATTVYNFFKGQYGSITFDSINKAMDPAQLNLYPLASYSNVTAQTQQMYGEERYICPAGMIVGAARKAGITAAYQYHYDNPHLGSNHASEMGAIFGPSSSSNADDLTMFTAMREYWSSFVTDLKPASKSGIAWVASRDSTASPQILLQPAGLKMEEVDAAKSKRCAYWQSLGPEMQT